MIFNIYNFKITDQAYDVTSLMIDYEIIVQCFTINDLFINYGHYVKKFYIFIIKYYIYLFII